MKGEFKNKSVAPRSGDALIVVDVQRDFLPGGSLAVAHGDEVVAPLNHYMRIFERKGLPVFATRDWHPTDHCSFRERGGRWPVHCVVDTPGAGFAAGLEFPTHTRIVSKDTEPGQETYSGFQATETNLAGRLRELGVNRLFIGGIATDYCVLFTVLDALAAGFEVCLLEDAIRPVEVVAGDGEAAIREMQGRGAVPVALEQLADV
jgi:nicotinamidase/pyrazinamidase